MASGRRVGAAIYRGAINSKPSDQTNLKQRCRLDPMAVEEPTSKRSMTGGTRRLACRWGQPAPPIILLGSVMEGCLLVSSSVFWSCFCHG
jgi:hypothetical protein